MKKKLALIVTYNPPLDFFSNLDIFYAQFDQIIIVDNNSDSEILYLLESEAQKRNRSLKVLYNKANLGIAAALNQGFQWAITQGYKNIITFDQDSQPMPGMIEALFNVFVTCSKDDHIAVVAPIVMHPTVNNQARYLRSRNRLLFERVSCNENILEDVTYVITSGAFYNLATYQEIGPFREDFFIDYVDTEYCLRARKKGFRIVVACKAQLYHFLGNQQRRKIMGRIFYPTFHSALRWYYISRNRISMLRLYALRFPHWLFFELGASINSIFRMLLILAPSSKNNQ